MAFDAIDRLEGRHLPPTSPPPWVPSSFISQLSSQSSDSTEPVPSPDPSQTTSAGEGGGTTGSGTAVTTAAPGSGTTASAVTYTTDLPLGASTSATLSGTTTAAERSSLSTNPSTFNTQPSSSQTTGVGETGSHISGSQPSSTSLPDTSHGYNKHQGLSPGVLAAAIVVPIVGVALLALLVAFLLRRRRRRNSNIWAGFSPITREKTGEVVAPSGYADANIGDGVEGTSDYGAAATPAPIITSPHNRAYFTGLDTLSQASATPRVHSGEFYAPARRSDGSCSVDPPPPYQAGASGLTEVAPASGDVSGNSDGIAAATDPKSAPAQDVPEVTISNSLAAAAETTVAPQHRELERLPTPDLGAPPFRSLSPFMDRDAATSSEAVDQPNLGAFLQVNGQNNEDNNRGGGGHGRSEVSSAGSDRAGRAVSRSNTARSFTSTMYSDNASVHTFHVAPVRMSVSRAKLVTNAKKRQVSPVSMASRAPSDPFDDPSSAVSEQSAQSQGSSTDLHCRANEGV